MLNLPVDLPALDIIIAALSGMLILWVLWRIDAARQRRPVRGTGDDGAIAMLFEKRALLDVSPAARAMLGPTAGTPAPGWDQAARLLAPLFPGFPADPADVVPPGQIRLAPGTPGHTQPLCLTAIDGRVRLDLAPEDRRSLIQPAMLRQIEELHTLRRAADHSPLAVWQSGRGPRILWANATYRALARDMAPDFPTSRGIAPLFAPADLDTTEAAPRRVSLTLPNGGLRWFSLTSARSGDTAIHYAHSIDSVVQAETVQRNFVQTLTKTFATLSIGLAIFDRDRRLALFNPALIDLTALPADFLSARPALSSVFDRMRDSQTMPEPRDYSSWRQRMTDLVAAAADGKFLETWVLPGGQTYRVTGRPHPDGAVAFVFEDISAEMTLTRRFRSELGLGKAVLNHLPQAIAVFSPAGLLTVSNTAYLNLWKADPNNAFAETTAQDALRLWRDQCRSDADWSLILGFLNRRLTTLPQPTLVRMMDGRMIECRAATLTGGYAMVMFVDLHAGTSPAGIEHLPEFAPDSRPGVKPDASALRSPLALPAPLTID